MIKKFLVSLVSIVVICGLMFVFTSASIADTTEGITNNGPKTECTTIQSGELLNSEDFVITPGVDEWGYNYQAHMFNGGYCDAYRNAEWCQDYVEDQLLMTWNDAWLSNKDCDDDGLLDRHYEFDSYRGSGAWLTNHQWGSYESDWSIVGEWVLNFDWLGGHYVHNMSIVDDAFTGTGVGTFTPYQTWTVTGDITGNEVSMLIDYDDSAYWVDVIGTIDVNGEMFGNWVSSSGQSGTWSSTEGYATRETIDWNYYVKIVAAPTYIPD